MSSGANRSFSVGFVLFIATLLAVVGLFVVGGPGIFERQSHYRILVESANNISRGSKVYLDGVVVGQVSSVSFQDVDESSSGPGNVVIRIAVGEQNAHRIRGGSVAWLSSEGLLGDQVVELSSGDWNRKKLVPDGEIPLVTRSFVEDLIGAQTRANAEALLDELVTLLRNVQKGEGSIGKFMKDPAFYDTATGLVSEAERTLAAAADLLEGMRSGQTPLSVVLLGEEDARQLSETLALSRSVAARLDDDDGLATALGPEFRSSLEHIASILDKIDRGTGSLGRLINDPTLADNLNNVFLGVREEPIVRNLIRNAEASGQKIYAEAASREDEEARLREAIAERARQEGEAKIVPAGATGAATPEGDGTPAPGGDGGRR